MHSPLDVLARAAGSRTQSEVISSDARWDADRILTSDVVVRTGATLTITEGVFLSARSDILDADPSPPGYSHRIEIIVDIGGCLEIKPGATLTALTDDGWGGIVFLTGSTGIIDGTVIQRAARGILIEDASPVIILWGSCL